MGVEGPRQVQLLLPLHQPGKPRAGHFLSWCLICEMGLKTEHPPHGTVRRTDAPEGLLESARPHEKVHASEEASFPL